MVKKMLLVVFGLLALAGFAYVFNLLVPNFFFFFSNGSPNSVTGLTNLKIGIYKADSSAEKLEFQGEVESKNEADLLNAFALAYPKYVDKKSGIYVNQIDIHGGAANVYFGGDEKEFTERMGSSGASIYAAVLTYALTEDKRIGGVKFKLKEAGSHFSPGFYTRDNFKYFNLSLSAAPGESKNQKDGVPKINAIREDVRTVNEDVSCFQPNTGKKTYDSLYFIVKDGYRYDFEGQPLSFAEGMLFDKKLYSLTLSQNEDLSFYVYFQHAGCNFSQMLVIRFTKGKGFDPKPMIFRFLDKQGSIAINSYGFPIPGEDLNFSTSWYNNGDGKTYTRVWKYDEKSNEITQIKETSVIK